MRREDLELTVINEANDRDQVSFFNGAPEDEDWRVFKPRIDDDGTSYETLRRLAKLPRAGAIAQLDTIVRANESYAPQALRLRVAASLLRDLIHIGWELYVDPHWIYVRPPKTANLAERKESIRQQLLFGRNDQLAEDSNRRFLFSLERPSKYASTKPITELIADGRRLAEQLERVLAAPQESKAELLKQFCQPYLQLVSEERDQYTNIRLIDIWRYFRHSWVNRYRSSPGRNLSYLVRDAAQPSHPIIGIAALGNTVMQLTTRDRALGWTLDGLLKILDQGLVTDVEILAAFRRRLEEDYQQIYLDDLPVDKRIDHSVDEETLSRIAVLEEDAQKDREDSLRSDEGSATKHIGSEDLSPERLLELTKTPLYRSKRARVVREILRAYRTLGIWTGTVKELAQSEEGVWAMGVAIKQLKKRFSATSMMEITVCGSVAPYNHLLGGKLVCLMMMSPRVVQDYRDRYDDVVSIIASQMAGRAIIKEPHLAFLGTTSLYTDYSAQYNRVRLPAKTVAKQSLPIEYRCLGRTEGFGSPNLSSETERGLAYLAETSKNYRNVNFVFGEGQSPKLRQLREGFSALGLNQSNLLQHGAPRIIYGVSLVGNLERVLLGVDDPPRYAIDPESENAESDIADYWISRWLSSRLNHRPALEAVANSSPLKERVSRFIPERSEGPSGSRTLFQNQSASGKLSMTTDAKADERLKFIRLLYRNESAFSDHVSVSRLKELNIRTKLEDVVRKIVRAGGSVVITGNAGDGKTHAILLMKNDLKEAEVITDASEYSAEEIATRWQSARDQAKPFCIAINEGPLVDLVRTYRDKHPWLEEIRGALLKLVGYRPLDSEQVDDEAWKPKPDETIVVDLSLRRVLSADLTKAIIEKLTDDQWYQVCSSCPALNTCGVTYNRKLLRSSGPQERMVRLLTVIGERGARVTFREALAFVSYLIFGGRTCDELAELGKTETTRYYWNAFEGEGAIFDHLSRGLDPLKQTDANVDEKLWRGILKPEEFVGNEFFPVLQKNLDELADKEPNLVRDDFTALKRRWYFEHKDGRLVVFSDADKLFKELQDPQQAMAIRLSHLLALINGWWNKGDETKKEALRLWTRLSYSPRPRRQAMVSGHSVPRPKLSLYKPELAPVLRRAFGEQPINHLILASVVDPRFARLVIDTTLLQALMTGAISEGSEEIARRLSQFNDTLAQYAEKSSDIRTIEIVDPHSELRTTVVVDLANRRYDSAT